MLLLFLLLLSACPPLDAQSAEGDPALLRLPDVTLLGEETALLAPPPPLRPSPLEPGAAGAAWPERAGSPDLPLRSGSLPAAPAPLPPALSFITPGTGVPGFGAAAVRSPGQAELTYVPGSLVLMDIRSQAALGRWSVIPALHLAAGDVWLSPGQERRSRLYAGLKGDRAYDALDLGLEAELGYLGPDPETQAGGGTLPFSLTRQTAWRHNSLELREAAHLLGSRGEDFAALLAERLEVEAVANPLGARLSLQTFVTLDEGEIAFQTGLEALSRSPAGGLILEGGAALRRYEEAWRLLPMCRIRYAPVYGIALRAGAEPFLGLPAVPGFLLRNAYGQSPTWQPEAGYRAAAGAQVGLHPGLEADLEAACRWGSFYSLSAAGWLFAAGQAVGTLTGRLLYRADSRLRFRLLAGADFEAPGSVLRLYPQTLEAGMEIDFNKPLFTFILELLWGRDPVTEPDPVLSPWGSYYSGTAVTLKTDWYLSARHILTQGICYKTTESGGELRYMLAYGIRRAKE